MTVNAKVSYPITCENGGIIYPVPNPNIVNMTQPDISVVDTAQKYDIGTKWEYNGRVYHYAYSKGTVGPNMGAKIYNHQDVKYSVAAATSPVGATDISITVDTNDGIGSAVFAKDYLKGGVCVIYDKTLGVGYEQIRGIIGNDALSGAGTLKIYLDAPLSVAFTVAVGYAEATASPWAGIAPFGSTAISGERCACAGVPAVHATTGQWLWVQTWGLCWVSPSATLGTGDNNHLAVFQSDGSVTDQDASNAAVGQTAGWCVANDYGAGQGAPFIYLMIAR